MSNTIKLLEAIGSDASLRNASAQELECALTRLLASEGLKHAAISGDSKWLIGEFGRMTAITRLHVNQAAPANDDEEQAGVDVEESNDDDQDAPVKSAS